uniref:Male-specific lethal 1 n=1 Tax=Lygus hesperus TaxID=30085 RepID=A0A0A9YC31_LYGHE
MSVSSPVRDLRLSDEKTEMVSPTENSARLDISGALMNLRKDIKTEESKEEVRKELEMFNMKELMLIHLDYIQQQSEVAQIKDKLIADLEHQVETLKQRLHRMTRRVSLNKTRSASSSAHNGVAASKPYPGSNQCSTSADPGTQRTNSAQGPAPLLRKKRQQSNADTNHTGVDEPPLKKINKISSKKDNLGSRVRRTRTPSESSKADLPDRSVLNKLKGIWTTPETYTTIVGETESGQRWAGSSAADIVCKQVVQQNSKAALEVPKWRIHTYTPIYSMEGTENLSDDVYERKHCRLATDEKRRKRWDVQRIREQRQVERLREKEEARKKARDENSGTVETNSFWPEPPELGERLTLCVSDEVPIGFCGINLFPPSKEDSEFTLPWKNGNCEQCPLKPRRRGKR